MLLQVCDALEAEQQRLRRTYHFKEQELGRMRAHATYLRQRISWTYQVRAARPCWRARTRPALNLPAPTPLLLAGGDDQPQ